MSGVSTMPGEMQDADVAVGPLAREAHKLAWMFANGKGVKKTDMNRAIYYYETAAARGLLASQNNLGTIYRDGKGVEVNYTASREWFRKAAENGLAQAMLNLGTMCTLGQGAVNDDIEAAEWYRLAAEKHLPGAQFAYANSLGTGKGVKLDVVEALKWCETAASQGHAKAKEALPRFRKAAGK